MQFVTNGPQVPERLIQAHEEGRVVFFCGAGISYPAKLPGFKGLVDRVYSEVGEIPSPTERAAIKAAKYDTAIGLLESRIAPDGRGRELVRRAVAAILAAADMSEKATATHAALLALGRLRNGQTRLVTTNFDCLFEEVIRRDGLQAHVQHAPLLPVPKNRWDGLVYLHGLITPTGVAQDLDRLVLSSGDFGLAYLIERWAARFVSELFRAYTVCFVGYSINDPVLRYMMDALAADRLLGESPPEMYAFGSHARGQEEIQAAEWRAKNVTPILYREHNRHAYLHRTLQAWASTYRDGVTGKEQIITQYANAEPQHSTTEEDFVGRVLWALSDKSGLPAVRFADIVPAPPFSWVDTFVERRFGRDDLSRFGVAPLPARDEARALSALGSNKLEFSILERPSPYLRAPRMAVVRHGSGEVVPDDVMLHLARWMLRYLDEPKLILWLAKHGANLRVFFAESLERRLSEIGRWEQEGDAERLRELGQRSPQAIPRKLLRPIWHLMLAGRVLSGPLPGSDLYVWFDRFERDGLTMALRLTFRNLLAPCITVREPFRSVVEGNEADEQERLRSVVDWELTLKVEGVYALVRERTGAEWRSALPFLADDLTALLLDAIDLMAALGAADSRSDLSYLFRPSISDHDQNRDFYDWTVLIELTRDAWLAIAEQDPARALSISERWWSFDYPIFRRLTFFTATHAGVVPAEKALGWLIADRGWWVWSSETEREVMQLLASLAPRLDTAQRAKLERIVQAGPPREMYRTDLSEDRWAALVDREVWQRLAKIRSAGTSLGEDAQSRLSIILSRNPGWRLTEDQQDEFPVWMGQGDSWRSFEATPRLRKDLMQWLREHAEGSVWDEDDWAERCRKDFPTTACALVGLAREGFWPTSRWLRALHAWSEERLTKISWRRFADFFVASPDDALADLSHGVGKWLQAVAAVFVGKQDAFFTLCQRILLLSSDEPAVANDPVTNALNHPIGYVTQALLAWWYRRNLKNGQKLPVDIEPIFTQICDPRRAKLRPGRALLAAHSINLFLVDRPWFDRYLLPLFGWDRSIPDAQAAWQGFLSSPRLVREHLAFMKQSLLDTALHYHQLGNYARQYASFLTYAAVDRGDTFTAEELRGAFRALPEAALAEAANALVRGVEGAGDQREAYWTGRVAPFWKQIWPKSAQTSTSVADDLFRLCIAAGASFPDALNTVRAWLVPIHYPSFLVHLLEQSDLCSQFPSAALEWLHLLVDSRPGPMPDLRICLQKILLAEPALVHDQRYRDLDQQCRRHGY